MKKYLGWFIFLTSLWLVTTNVTFAATSQPLAPDKAFKLSAQFVSNHKVILTWDIAPGTYLYAKRIHVQIQKPMEQLLENLSLPNTAEKITTKTNEVELIYKKQLSFDVDLPSAKNPTENYQLMVQYQGCSESGYCYPPRKQTLLITPSAVEIVGNTSGTTSLSWFEKQKQFLTEPERIIAIFSDQSFALLIIAFFIFGLLLSLTPCVLPMVPILSNIILGQGKNISTKKGFLLSLSYVLGMSCTYAILGIVAALLGYSLQAAFQNPWILSTFAFIFVLLALASFGVYELQPPEWFRNLLSKQSDALPKQHTLISTAIMGIVSSIVVSPCVTAPFIGALAYISQSGNVAMGGIALFVLGFGMGVPLLVTGVAGGKLLPHAGAWMEKIKELFGIFLLLVAVELLSRFSNQTVSNSLWSLTFFIGAVLFLNVKSLKTAFGRLFWRALAVTFFLTSLYFLLQINAVKDLIYPPKQQHHTSSILSVTNFSQLKKQLDIAKRQHQAVLLDFYADWCRACKDMEQTTFHDPNIKAVLKNFKMIRVDITANDQESQLLMQHFKVIAPPVLIFLSSNGDEMPNHRIIGEIDAISFKRFAQNVCGQKQTVVCLE